MKFQLRLQGCALFYGNKKIRVFTLIFLRLFQVLNDFD